MTSLHPINGVKGERTWFVAKNRFVWRDALLARLPFKGPYLCQRVPSKGPWFVALASIIHPLGSDVCLPSEIWLVRAR